MRPLTVIQLCQFVLNSLAHGLELLFELTVIPQLRLQLLSFDSHSYGQPCNLFCMLALIALLFIPLLA